MFSFFSTIIFLLLNTPLATANVEKTIFLGPAPVNIPPQSQSSSPSLADLRLDVLTPDDDDKNNNNWSLRAHLPVRFPSDDAPRGQETWLLLDALTEGRRYEVRVCWLATQPTAFHLETFPLDHVFETPELITSLYNYSMSRQASPSSTAAKQTTTEHQASLLFLRVSAAADYFTTNRTLMDHPEPVLVDLILDPFVFNILPRTLVPTVGFVVLVALVSWVLGVQVVRPWLTALVEADDGDGEKKTQ